MKIAVIGSRTFNDFTLLEDTLNNFNIDTIISGGAKGADKLAEEYADKYNIKTLIFEANWKKYGNAAGPIRNKFIIENADYVIAFWDGKSKGTLSSINIAKKLNKTIKIVKII